MILNKIWWDKIFLSLAIFNCLVWAQSESNKIIKSRINGVGFQMGTLRSSITFQSKYVDYEGSSYYTLSGLWFKVNPLPAIFLAINREYEVAGSKRFFLYVPVMIQRKALFEFEIAYLKGFQIRDLNSGSDRMIDLVNFKSTRILGSITLFLNPDNFSWKHAFSFGERQIKSGGSWALGGDLGVYSFNTGLYIPLIMNDSNVIAFRKMSMLFLDVFFGAYYNLIIKSWHKAGKTKVLGMGGSLLFGISMQGGNVTINNRDVSAGRIEIFGLINGSFHMLYTTDRWIFRLYAFARKHNISLGKLLTIGNHWSNASFQVIYLFGAEK